MKFSEHQLDQLTTALYDDARASGNDSDRTSAIGLSYEELKAQMTKHPGLLENLSIRYIKNYMISIYFLTAFPFIFDSFCNSSLDRLLLPSAAKTTKIRPTFKTFCSYVKNNVPFVVFIIAYAIVNIGLFVSRIIQYKDTNIFYILARACGKILPFPLVF